MDRNLPHAAEMEKKILSAMMLKDGEAIPTVTDVLTASDFYRPENRIIFNAILKVHERGIVDPILVEEQLRRDNELERIDRAYFLNLIELEYTIHHAAEYAKEIHKKSQLRQLVYIGEELADRAGRDLEPVDVLLNLAEKKLLAASGLRIQTCEHAEPIIMRTLENLRARQKGGLQGLSTGLIDLDGKIGGLKKSDLIILAARPSMGKTALALNIATYVSRHVPTVIFSLEMSKEQLMDRVLSSFSQVDATDILNGSWRAEESAYLLNAVAEISKLNLFIDDAAALSLMEIRTRARRLKQEHDIGLIVIDYIQLMQGSKEFRGNRVQEVSEISRGLKALARELDVPVIALSQLSRNVELRAEKKPQLSDLRDSGSIEQDADIVTFLYREEYYDPENADEQGRAQLIVAKNRNGATGSVHLQFERKILQFRNFCTNNYDHY